MGNLEVFGKEALDSQYKMLEPFFGKELKDYLTDAAQRYILFLNVLRQRGNEEEEITARPLATVLTFDHDIIMSGRSLPRPINYNLIRIIPKPGTTIKPGKAPVVIVDPRAGQGPGIGGFKRESEIGVALDEGHPVYLIGFSAEPVPGQTFLDVVHGQLALIQRVVSRHPDAPRPIVFGNCQAGYQAFMSAMLNPELFGTLIMAGSPISYWQGVHGKNPMRYSGGLLGGSWLTAFASDLGNGKFDGANLIANFDNLNPSNFLWSKQYYVYENVDTEADRYLEFEKWWGDFILLNGKELQYLVDELFIGNKLTSLELHGSDGRIFDPRSVKCPILCFTSMGDNISPPQQTLGWILDLYRDVDEITQRGQTIAYCVDPGAGHLAIFVSTKVASKEDAAFVRTLYMLECLPPGLYELVLTPKREGEPGADLVQGEFIASFEPRTLDNIRAFGRNSIEDDCAFDSVAKVSERNYKAYSSFVRPFVQNSVNEPMADMFRRLNPIRLSYTMFADSNPLMAPVKKLAAKTGAHRKSISSDNPFLQAQEIFSDQIVKSLDLYREARDLFSEAVFYSVYGSPLLQAFLGTDPANVKRPHPPDLSEEEEAQFAKKRAEAASHMQKGGIEEGIVRSLLYILEGSRRFDERIAVAMRGVAEKRNHLGLMEIKNMVLEQGSLLRISDGEAIKYLPDLVPEIDDRRELIRVVTDVLKVTGAPGAYTNYYLDEVKKTLNLQEQIRPRRGKAKKN